MRGGWVSVLCGLLCRAALPGLVLSTTLKDLAIVRGNLEIFAWSSASERVQRVPCTRKCLYSCRWFIYGNNGEPSCALLRCISLLQYFGCALCLQSWHWWRRASHQIFQLFPSNLRAPSSIQRDERRTLQSVDRNVSLRVSISTCTQRCLESATAYDCADNAQCS